MKKPSKENLLLISIVYLAGIFMGAIDTGIVTPARTIIQNTFGLDAQTGIWMITIYTLAYAASIPIMGKLADNFGRKAVYITCISLFGIGSLLCGLSQTIGGFPLLLFARVVQAIGGGGILPIATAEFGTAFPAEKRGMALGLVGGVYGLANIFGASAGSAILDIFGVNNWQFIFYINIPITLFIIVAGLMVLSNQRSLERTRLDLSGITLLTSMILSLLYGLKNLDYFNLTESIRSLEVYPFLLIFLTLLPIFIWVEKKAANPVMNLKYFTNRNILITLLISFISGIVIMGMIFVPQFSENLLKIPTGSGGYLVIILGLFAGIGAPVSGRLIDRFSVKLVLSVGFVVSIIGALFLTFVTTAFPNMATVFLGLMFTGIGIGFTMGTPLNYMMLQNTEKSESNSALATLSLIRSIGTAIAPAIMVGFLAHAGLAVQSNVMNLFPTELSVPALPYAQEIQTELNSLKEDEALKSRLGSLVFPDLSTLETVRFDRSGGAEFTLSQELLDLMQNSDVTTITENSKTLAGSMFDQFTPGVIGSITGGLNQGVSGIGTGVSELSSAIAELEGGVAGISKGIVGMETAVSAQKSALSQLELVASMVGSAPLPANTTVADLLPVYVRSSLPAAALVELAGMTSLEDLDRSITALEDGIGSLEGKIGDSKASRSEMSGALATLESTRDRMVGLGEKMSVLGAAVPGAFQIAEVDYLEAIDAKGDEIEGVFQRTLNVGFKNVYLTSVVASTFAIVFLVFYVEKKKVVGE